MQVDAIRAPLKVAGLGVTLEKLDKLTCEFEGVLGGKPIFVRLQGSEYFISLNPNDLLYHSSSHNHYGKPRYDWAEQSDGVSYGYLVDYERARGNPQT